MEWWTDTRHGQGHIKNIVEIKILFFEQNQSQLTLDASSLKHFDIVSVDLKGWTDTRNGHFLVLVPVHPPLGGCNNYNKYFQRS